ncbi:thymopoietin a isoform X2 [Brienomyrus brachyistius]|uniref:thymopoietin a isoform X2 n=1 Tax=Brienomyrus brachyistius TaxID=42636 RepID=UPI0020B3E11C|nr:thymopoietin a isoform X2 [Brienomyrus brachyistius]
MSEFLEDPSVLTKDKLKNELLANNVALPSGEHKKDVYVQLYLKNLTAQNKRNAAPDAFSSDEDLPPPVVSNKSRSGRKATRKTDKPRPEDVDVTDLTDEGLKAQLLKYGVNPGPIVASTRKLYEKKLQKLIDQGPPEASAPVAAPPKPDSNQNGNTDSDQYSDKEEEEQAAPSLDPEPIPEPVPVVERPVRSRGKSSVSLRSNRHGANREEEEEEGPEEAERWPEEQPPLNVKRHPRTPQHWRDQTVPASDDTDMSESSASEMVVPPRTLTGSRSYKQDCPRVPRAPRSPLPAKPSTPLSVTRSDRIASPSEAPRASFTLMSPLQREAAAVGLESCPPRFTHKDSPIASFSQHLSKRPLHRPRGQTPSDSRDECRSSRGSDQNIHHTPSSTRMGVRKGGLQPDTDDKDTSALPAPERPQAHLQSLLNTALLERGLNPRCSLLEQEGLESIDPSKASQCGWRQQKILSTFTPERLQSWPCTPVAQGAGRVDERPAAALQTPTADGKDILKEMFPNEVGTPTGITATCRRPIRGAAGRPLKPSDFWLDESLLHQSERLESRSYMESRGTPRPLPLLSSSSRISTAAPPAGHACARRSLPVWVQLLLLTVVAGFLFFVYQAMETNHLNPFVQEGDDPSPSSSAGGSTAD